MSQERIFADDWRDCLRSQYIDVVRQQSEAAITSLSEVLLEAGFNEDELAALRLEATMRAEDMPDDYVPEEITAAVPGVDLPSADALVEEVEEAAEDVEPTYDELVEEAETAAPEGEDNLDDESEDDGPDEDQAAQQLSLF